MILKKKKPLLGKGFKSIAADWTGLEPATSAVTGRHSNQLNYQSKILKNYLVSPSGLQI